MWKSQERAVMPPCGEWLCALGIPSYGMDTHASLRFSIHVHSSRLHVPLTGERGRFPVSLIPVGRDNLVIWVERRMNEKVDGSNSYRIWWQKYEKTIKPNWSSTFSPSTSLTSPSKISNCMERWKVLEKCLGKWFNISSQGPIQMGCMHSSTVHQLLSLGRFFICYTVLLPPTLAKDVLDLSLANPVVVPESCGTTEVIKVDPAPQ